MPSISRALLNQTTWYILDDPIVWTTLNDIYPQTQAQTIERVKPMPNDRSHLYNVFSHSTNVLNHFENFPKILKKEYDPLIIGVELEVSTDYNMKELIDAQEEVFLIGKQDGSLSGSKRNLIELVTCPASIKYLKRNFALFFDKLDYMKFDTSLKTNNGMHIHISRDHFENRDHERNFIWFFNNPANIKFHFLISERPNISELQSWSPPHYYSNGQSKVYSFKEGVQLTYYNRGITHQKGGTSGKTIELRLFKGIVSYATIVKNMEYADATFEFSRTAALPSDLTIRKFLSWLKKTPLNKYICLKEFIETHIKLSTLEVEMDINEVIFQERNPTKILPLLEKAKFEVTEDHVKYLNKKVDKAFCFNKKTKKVELIPAKSGKLSAKDKSLANRILSRINRNPTGSDFTETN